MATFTAIKNATQSGGAMRGVLNYIKRKDKTLWEGRRLVTGWNCVAQSAYEEMMTTKARHQKTGDRMFYQFVQSFHPEEDVTPEEVHAIGLELAQRLFPDFEVVVATHVDTNHLHSHLIVNSVSYATGRKLHQNAADLPRQRQISDEICAAHGLTVLEPPKKYAQEKKMRPGEYRAAARGESWKFRLMSTIEECMRRAGSREAFIREMERQGYQVRWENARKYITYTTPGGQKCRDIKLHGDKFWKERMEREFRIREEILRGGVDGVEPGGRAHGAGAGGAAGPARPDQQTADAAGGAAGGLPASAQSVPGGGAAGGNRTGTDGHPSVDGAAQTGWEKERAAYLVAQDPAAPAQATPALLGLAVPPGGAGGLVGDLARVERSLDNAHDLADLTTPAHTDRKRWRELQQKRLSSGHRPDDHEQKM